MLRTLQRQDLLLGMHDGRVGRDRSPQDIVRVGEVDDDYLVLVINLFSYTDEAVRLESQCLRRDS
jgi:hypothetical protein